MSTNKKPIPQNRKATTKQTNLPKNKNANNLPDLNMLKSRGAAKEFLLNKAKEREVKNKNSTTTGKKTE